MSLYEHLVRLRQQAKLGKPEWAWALNCAEELAHVARLEERERVLTVVAAVLFRHAPNDALLSMLIREELRVTP